jgi:hypothetical protein
MQEKMQEKTPANPLLNILVGAPLLLIALAFPWLLFLYAWHGAARGDLSFQMRHVEHHLHGQSAWLFTWSALAASVSALYLALVSGVLYIVKPDRISRKTHKAFGWAVLLGLCVLVGSILFLVVLTGAAE